MRILCFLHSFEPGGVERVALRLCESWQRADAEVIVALGRREGALGEDAPFLDYRLFSSGRISTAWFETLWMIVNLPSMIRRLRPDILFCAGNTYTIVAVVMKLLLGRRCPPIISKISNSLDRTDLPAPLRWFIRQWGRVQGRFIDHFVATAEPVRAEAARELGVSDQVISVIPNPVLNRADLDRLAASGMARRSRGEAGGVRFLAAGRLVAQKDFAAALKAFAEASGPADRLAIVGEGPERGALERLARQLGVEDRVVLPGHARSLVEWFARSDVFLLSSRYEGVPAVILEALAAAMPIVATDCCVAMADLLQQGRLGRLVPRGDLPALAAAVRASRDDRQDGALARAQAAGFTVESASDAYVRTMTMLARREPLPRELSAMQCGTASLLPSQD
ncbi:glycosyltransferase [Flavisphingomonas formosensis]|uniref:glycosyltransferase n=1 Tax=Flavisphingomonas formosensis TaxID=861534 RepID=UPI0018DFF6B2|nr:glycosyltransferase [Sphingomonas formosensis]